MEQNLNRFSVFVMEGASFDDALDFCAELGIEKNNIFVYKNLKIADVRNIKEESALSSNHKCAFVFGEIGFDAQNALLKLLEEPSDSNYFVLYKNDSLLDTVKSRAQLIKRKHVSAFDKELADAIKNNNINALIIKALKMQDYAKDEIVSLLEGTSKELSSSEFEKSLIINKEIIKLKQFNLNRKLFLFTLFFRLFGSV